MFVLREGLFMCLICSTIMKHFLVDTGKEDGNVTKDIEYYKYDANVGDYKLDKDFLELLPSIGTALGNAFRTFLQEGGVGAGDSRPDDAGAHADVTGGGDPGSNLAKDVGPGVAGVAGTNDAVPGAGDNSEQMGGPNQVAVVWNYEE